MRLTLISSLVVAGLASLGSARHDNHDRSIHKVRSVHSGDNASQQHSLAARSIDVSVHKNDPRTLCILDGILGWNNPFCNNNNHNWPSKDWTCSGSGLDGWDVDYNGNKCPGNYPAGWKFFGSKHGWGPPAGWTCSDDFSLPDDFLNKCSIFTWWKPLLTWKKCPTWLPIPSWWPIKPPKPTRPSQDWQCDGSGNDGWDVDYNGNGCPYQADKLFDSNGKWKWFGTNKGWQPSEPWNIPYPDWTPPQGWTDVECAKATWWVPGSFWKYPANWKIPSFWKDLDPNWCSYLDDKCGKDPHDGGKPSEDWVCDGSGNDGWDVDYNGNGCPYQADKLFDSNGKWKWFGKAKGWQPSEPWNIPYADWTPPQGWTDVECAKATWWVPGSFWKYPANWKIPSFWKSLDPNWCSYLDDKCGKDDSKPPSDWNCNGSGDDGWDVDHEGHGKPDWCPIGWKWFGIKYGWHPIKGWKLPDSHWSPPKQWQPKLCTWWKPQTTWYLNDGFWCAPWWPKNLLIGNFLNFF